VEPTALKAVILGIVQGLTEFLPVSSSGHLVLGQRLFGFTSPELFFDIVLHLGTLLAVLIVFRADVRTLTFEIIRAPRTVTGPGGIRNAYRNRANFRLLILILIGSIPTALVGVVFKLYFESFFASSLVVGLALLITGAVLFATRLVRERGRGLIEFGLAQALAIGLVQGLAVTPGISRSGLTICTGLFLGLDRTLAARYSFLLSVPAILGALLIEAGGSGGGAFNSLDLGLGFLTALFSGWAALVILLKMVKGGRLHYFSYYCWLAAVFSLCLTVYG